MKNIFNYYLENHIIDAFVFFLLLFVIYRYDFNNYIHIEEKASLYSSLIGFSGTVWSFGSLAATILVSINPNVVFNDLLKELGHALLKNIFKSLGYILICILIFISLSFNFIKSNNVIEISMFLFALLYLFTNTIRFSILLFRILKIRIS